MKRTAIALTLILTLLISLMVVVQPAKSSTKTIVVPDDFPTIKKAADNANAGDTVYVKAGTYDIAAEGYTNYLSFICLFISKPISLIGENCQSTIINATVDSKTLLYSGINVGADNVTISGFTIISNRNAVQLNGNNNTLTGNIIKLTGAGLAIGNGNGNVSSNIIEGAGRGDGINTNTNSTVSNNIIRNFTVGITSLLLGYNQSIFDNTIANNSIGARLTMPALFYHNKVENCSQYSVYCATPGNVNATYNWWGTTNKQEISQKIFDNKNDSNLGTVTFEPFLTQPNADSTPSANGFPSPLIFTIIAASGVSLAVVGIGLLVYFKKRKHQSIPSSTTSNNK